MVSSDHAIRDNDFESVSLVRTPIFYPPRNVWKAKIRLGKGWVEKDYREAPLLPRLLGQISLHLEAVALKKLREVEGVPQYLGRPRSHAIRMTRLPGTPLAKLEKGELSEFCFRRIQELLHRVHSKGVAHGDLHMKNILIHEDKPFIVDFSTAYVRGRLPLLDKNVFRLVELLDLERLYKIEWEFFGRGTPPPMFYLYRLIKGIR